MCVISYITPTAHISVAHKAKSEPTILHNSNFTDMYFIICYRGIVMLKIVIQTHYAIIFLPRFLYNVYFNSYVKYIVISK